MEIWRSKKSERARLRHIDSQMNEIARSFNIKRDMSSTRQMLQKQLDEVLDEITAVDVDPCDFHDLKFEADEIEAELEKIKKEAVNDNG